MTNRKKRLKKGIESIHKEIEKHEIKRQNALKDGKLELANYYTSEIDSLEKQKEKKENKLEDDQKFTD